MWGPMLTLLRAYPMAYSPAVPVERMEKGLEPKSVQGFPWNVSTPKCKKPRPPRSFIRGARAFACRKKSVAPYAAMVRAGSLLLLSPAVPTAVIANQRMLPGMLPSELYRCLVVVPFSDGAVLAAQGEATSKEHRPVPGGDAVDGVAQLGEQFLH